MASFYRQLSLSAPKGDALANFLAGAGDITSPARGATADGPPPAGQPPAGYDLDHNRQLLGHGEDVWRRAQEALADWRMFDVGWVRAAPAVPIESGATVCVAARIAGLWICNAARIVYTLHDEQGALRRFGFGYATLNMHVERGEERFMVTWDRRDDSVNYDLYAFSQPGHPLVALARPFARWMQRRFARDSKAAMARAAAGLSPTR